MHIFWFSRVPTIEA